MRVLITGIALVAACGSVNEAQDAGDDAIDAAIDGAPPASGAIRWVRSLSGAVPAGIAEGAGGVVITGYFTTIADLGGTVFTSAGGYDTVVASYAVADASHIYSTRFGDTGGEFGFLDNVEPQGAPIVAGVAYANGPSATYDLGQGPMTGGGGPGSDGFVGRYGPAAPAWVKRVVGPGEDKLNDTALGPSTVFAVGWYETSTTVDTTNFLAAGGRDFLFTRWNSFTGELQVARSFGSPGRDEASGVATVPAGGVIATGYFDGTLVLGTTALASAGLLDVWVAAFTADGMPTWAVRFGGAAEDRETRVVTDDNGDIYLAGTFAAPIAFGAVNLTPVGGIDVFVAKLRGGDGTVLWAISFGSAGTENVSDIAVDAAGRVYVSASVSGALEPGGPYAGALDAALVSFDQQGTRRWSRVLGTAGDDRGTALAIGMDATYFGLSVAGMPNLDGVPIIGAPSPAGLLLKLQP